MKQGRTTPMKGGDEYDALTNWRQLLCYLGHSGVAKKVKRGYNKRVRKEGKNETKNLD